MSRPRRPHFTVALKSNKSDFTVYLWFTCSECGRKVPVNLTFARTDINVVITITNFYRIGIVMSQVITLFFLLHNSSSLNLVTKTIVICVLVTKIYYNHDIWLAGRWARCMILQLTYSIHLLPYHMPRKENSTFSRIIRINQSRNTSKFS